MTPSILLCYPSSFHCSIGIDDVDVKMSLLVLGSHLGRDYPVTYMDFEVAVGRPDSPSQIRRFERRVRDYFVEHPFDILGLSCWTSMSYQATLLVARLFRELYPDRLIVVGGYHPTARPREFLTADRLFDYVVAGEAEQAFRQIAESFGTAGRPAETVIVDGTKAAVQEFVPYDWNLVDPFVREYFPEGLPKLYVLLSRGCPFECSFCMESLKERRWRALPPRQALDLLHEAVDRYRPRIVGIADACFGLNPGWRKEFLRLLADSRPSYQVIFETRTESIDAEDVALLAGLDVEVQFGIESGSPEVLSLMRKTRRPEQYLERFRRTSRLLTKHRVLHRANMIFNHPGETEKTLRETFDLIDRMLDVPDSYLMWICRPYMHYPGCELDNNRAHYEQRYGARFYSPEWWKEEGDQYLASLNSVPSADLAGERKELWGQMLTQREERFRTGLAAPAFVYAAEKYFPEWLEERRYQQV
jgi:radical SAM superfamily enzyme YgiQ (UPF0313 family)